MPDDLNLSFLVGTTLLQVCIGANEVILKFDREVSITIESRFRVRDANGHAAVFEDAPSSAASLAKLLSNSIIDVLGHQDGTLRLSFVKGAILEIYDSSKGYESYQIHHGQDIHVV
ncbi:MAG: hypothetical protein GY722_10615 [bacterium]|nr:hypothetical protein [bacterium]